MFIGMRKRRSLGFTLVELAIVLAVTGVLFSGLYRLLSGGNQQVKDTSIANQQIQVINAVKSFLQTSNGLDYMGVKEGANGTNDTSPTTFSLPLPNTTGNAPDGGANANCHAYMNSIDSNGYLQSFCDTLPAGFYSGTTNAYNQVFTIGVLPGSITHPAKTPATYAFMVLTSGGDTIPDADGGRISSEIGGDGGFIYSGTSGAYDGSTVYGSFGAWKATPGSYGLAGAIGHIGSRTYYSPETRSTDNWLARFKIDPSTSTTPNYNSMHTDLFLGLTSTGTNNTFWLGSDSSLTTGGGTINGQGGSIYMQKGVIDLGQGKLTDASSLGSSITIFPSGPTFSGGNYLSRNSAPKATGGNLISLSTNCTIDSNLASLILNYTPGDSPTNSATSNDCPSALAINGDANINGELQATALYAGTFIYNGSDRRLKKDIAPLAGSLDNLMKIEPVSFLFKANGQKGLGFIAQDLEKIYPELVSPHDEKSMKSVNYEGMVAPLVAAVQELKKENDALRDELAAQKRRQDQFEKDLKK